MGYAAVINAAWLNIYYIVILAWCLFYFLVSLTKGILERPYCFIPFFYAINVSQLVVCALQSFRGAPATTGGTRRRAWAPTPARISPLTLKAIRRSITSMAPYSLLLTSLIPSKNIGSTWIDQLPMPIQSTCQSVDGLIAFVALSYLSPTGVGFSWSRTAWKIVVNFAGNWWERWLLFGSCATFASGKESNGQARSVLSKFDKTARWNGHNGLRLMKCIKINLRHSKTASAAHAQVLLDLILMSLSSRIRTHSVSLYPC